MRAPPLLALALVLAHAACRVGATGALRDASGPGPAPASTTIAVSRTPSASVPSAVATDTEPAASDTSGTSVPSTPPPTTPSSASLSPLSTQPPLDPAQPHTFSPFPSPTQQPFRNLFVATDPRHPPPVQDRTGPAPIPDFNPAWAAAHARARELIAGLSLEEKVNITTGVGWMNGRCVGNTPPVGPTWPGLCLEDSPLGVRSTDFATVFPAGINAAATWQRALVRRRGAAMGREHRGKGVHVALGPMMNMGRAAAGGRNWEGFGGDPFLAGEAAYETVLGMQAGGVQACAKHYINNEQEHARTAESSNVDDRTQHEVYAHPFLRSVMAGVTSVMCSYNQVNGTYACENAKMLNGVLKREFGFQGFVMSDWQATHSTLSAVAGLDMTMPGDITFSSRTSYFGPNLTAAVQSGSVPRARLDDMAARVAAGWYFLHQDAAYPAVSFDAFDPLDPATNGRVDVQGEHWRIVRELGAASTVLLKNVNHTLPLQKPRALLLVGSDAGAAPGGPNQFADGGGSAGVLAMGWGSGTANFTYLVSPLEAIQARARQDRTSVNWHLDDFDAAGAGSKARQADVALVFVNADSGEEYITVDGNAGDRRNLTAWHGGDALVLAVAAQNRRTVVVVHSVGPLVVEPWIAHPNVSAVVWAGLGGTETGHALVDVLWGAVNPSGRLPYTIARDPGDYAAQVVLGGGGSEILQIDYTEGLLIDYRHFDARNITPRFEFGFGLSYTTFGYAGLGVEEIEDGAFAPERVRDAWEAGRTIASGEGASAALVLHEPAYAVTFTVKNTGKVAGTEIAQVYVHHPPSSGEPPAVLKGFADVALQPGEAKKVRIALSRYDLSVWDVVSQSWRRPKGTIRLSVGASSRDVRLEGQIPE